MGQLTIGEEILEIAFTGQPFVDAGNLRDFVDNALGDTRVDRLSVMSAWAKYSGLNRIRGQLETFRSRGGTSRLIVGIDEGGATEQGLRLALELFDTVHVLFDMSGRTFHPKVYLVEGTEVAHVLIGSNNLTAGGVFYNYEGAIQMLLDLASGKENEVVQQIVGYMDRLYADSAICRALDAEFLETLVSDPRYRIRDERARRRAPTGEATDDVDSHLDLDHPTPLFDSSSEPKRSVLSSGGSGATVPEPETIPVIPELPLAGKSSVAVQKRWFRRLSASDAQHPPSAKTAPTGNVRLNQAGHPIDQTSYFRDELLGTLPWTSLTTDRGIKESTFVPFHVTINGNYLGLFELVVDHAGYREAGQGNVTTVLHWGPLNQVMRASNYTDDFFVLERLIDGSFTLEITSTPPTTFIK